MIGYATVDNRLINCFFAGFLRILTCIGMATTRGAMTSCDFPNARNIALTDVTNVAKAKF